MFQSSDSSAEHEEGKGFLIVQPGRLAVSVRKGRWRAVSDLAPSGTRLY
jgi:hypothetical protein